MQITLNLRVLLPSDRFPAGGAELQMTRLVPLQMRRGGAETRLVLPGEAVVAPTIPRTSAWHATSGSANWRQRGVDQQIAAREGVSDSYVRHLVPLALLAPAIVECICAGRQSVCLSAERLKTQAGVPIEWDAQQRLFAD